MTTPAPSLRDLHGWADFEAVVELQRRVWGRDDDLVPAWMLAASVERGAILIGADADEGLVGFVYSVPAFKQGQPLQWSHLLAVAPSYRAGGLGRRLKLAQRERAIDQGLELIEWTFDPLVATNGNLNVARLGAVVEEYLENVYGASHSPLHGGLPTDRFVASWRIRTPHVQRRLEGGALVARDASLTRAPAVLETVDGPVWRRPRGEPRLDYDDPRLLVEIPYGFVDMLRQDPSLALEWRHVTRRVFTTCFARGYRVVDFLGSRESQRAAYLLQRES